MTRIIRWVLFSCTLVLLLAGCAYVALFYWLDASSVKTTVDRYAKEALNARVEIDGPIELQKLPDLTVQLPNIRFYCLETQKEVGQIRSARLNVSLWSLVLGAVHIKQAHVDGLHTTLNLPSLSTDALFDSTFNNVNFPKDLRVGALTLTDSNVKLNVNAAEGSRVFELSQLMFNVGAFSPEMATPYEFSTVYNEIRSDAPAAESAPSAESTQSAPTAPSVDEAANQPVVTEQPAEMTSETPTQQALPSVPVSPEQTDTAATQENEPKEPTPSASASSALAVEASDNQSNVVPAQAQPQTEAPAVDSEPRNAPSIEPVAETAPVTETTPAAEPAAVTESAAEATQPAVEPSQTPVSEPATKPLSVEAPQSSFVDQFIRRAIANALPDFDPNQPTFITPNLFDGPTHGAVSSTGRMTISTANRFVMFEDATFSAEVFRLGHPYSLVAKTDRIRFKGSEINGMNVNGTISRPDSSQGDVHLGAVDFRLRPGNFASPELRLAYTDYDGSRVTNLEIASSMEADFLGRKIDFGNFVAKINIADPETLPNDFVANISGSINLDLAQDIAQVALSGDLAGAPFSYSGSVSSLSAPKLRGELSLAELNLATIPTFGNMHWMHHVDFDGELRIGQLTANAFSAAQLHSRLRIQDNTLILNDIIVNLADGRLMGETRVSETGDWLFNGRIDSVSMDKLLPLFDAKPLVAGVAKGTLSLSGRGMNAADIKGHARLRLIRGIYHGINADAVRNRIVANGSDAEITREGAQTLMDESSAEISLANQRLKIDKLLSRSVHLRTSGEFVVDLGKGSINGKTYTIFAPQKGVPSVQVAATITGSSANPQWNFAWDEAQKSLGRALGKPTLTLPKQDDNRSIWQSVKDFFHL